MNDRNRYTNHKGLKRVVDVTLATAAIIFTSPLFLFAAIAVKTGSAGPIFFKQLRIGRGGEKFVMLKFRTMVVGAQQEGTGLFSYADDPRVTAQGRVLRKFSIDELPQLINVIRGEMSLVGPRPPVDGELPPCKMLSKQYRRRFHVLPGITGLAQISGRNELEWDEKVVRDNEYIDRLERWGILIDFYILAATCWRVLRAQNTIEPKRS